MISDAICIVLRPQVFQLVNRGTDTHAGSMAKECTLDPCSSPSQRTFIVFKNCCITKDSHKRVRKATLGSLPFPFYQLKKNNTTPRPQLLEGLIVTITLILVVWLTSNFTTFCLICQKITYNFQHQFSFFILSYINVPTAMPWENYFWFPKEAFFKEQFLKEPFLSCVLKI